MSCFPCLGPRLKEANKVEGSARVHSNSENGKGKTASFDSDGKKKRMEGKSAARSFTFRELATATRNFRPTDMIGEGGFGRVYKGRLESGQAIDGVLLICQQVVAIKQLNREGLQGNHEFLVEVLMLSLLHHPNLVNLIGYCADGDQRLLVYEYMPMGSLEQHLFEELDTEGPFVHPELVPCWYDLCKKAVFLRKTGRTDKASCPAVATNLSSEKEPLGWNMRIKVAFGAARGLEYLHTKADPPVIYRDLKSANILLDEDFNPKLSDFGLAKLGPVGGNTHVSTRVMGTYGYCAPEYAMSGKLTLKSDVYSFGVVLLELITGRKAIDTSREAGEQNLITWSRPFLKDRRKFVQIADPLLQGHYPIRSFHQAIAIAVMCLQEQPNFRPLIADVVVALEYLVSQSHGSDADGRRRSPPAPPPSSSSPGIGSTYSRERASRSI
ncbi:hypothetical protein ACLOJK_018473 [Asimina triloba]